MRSELDHEHENNWSFIAAEIAARRMAANFPTLAELLKRRVTRSPKASNTYPLSLRARADIHIALENGLPCFPHASPDYHAERL